MKVCGIYIVFWNVSGCFPNSLAKSFFELQILNMTLQIPEQIFAHQCWPISMLSYNCWLFYLLTVGTRWTCYLVFRGLFASIFKFTVLIVKHTQLKLLKDVSFIQFQIICDYQCPWRCTGRFQGKGGSERKMRLEDNLQMNGSMQVGGSKWSGLTASLALGIVAFMVDWGMESSGSKPEPRGLRSRFQNGRWLNWRSDVSLRLNLQRCIAMIVKCGCFMSAQWCVLLGQVWAYSTPCFRKSVPWGWTSSFAHEIVVGKPEWMVMGTRSCQDELMYCLMLYTSLQVKSIYQAMRSEKQWNTIEFPSNFVLTWFVFSRFLQSESCLQYSTVFKRMLHWAY